MYHELFYNTLLIHLLNSWIVMDIEKNIMKQQETDEWGKRVIGIVGVDLYNEKTFYIVSKVYKGH